MKNYGYIIKQKAVNVAGVENGTYIQYEYEVYGFATKEEAGKTAEDRINEIYDDDTGYEDDDFDYEITEND